MNRAKSTAGAVIVLLLLLALGCTDPFGSGNTVSPPQDGEGEIRWEQGVLGPGALYELWIPADSLWERTGKGLLLYVHGYVPATQPLALPGDVGAFRTVLLSMGFAVAYSSFSENGWAVEDGGLRTLELLDYFKAAYATPGTVLLVGASEGGLISLMLTENYPDLFDGTLLICAPVGGARMEIEYLFAVRILFDYFFRERLDQLAQLPPDHPDHESLGLVAGQLGEALGDSVLAATWAGSGLPANTADGKRFARHVAPVLFSLLADPAGAPSDEAVALSTMTADGRPLFNWDHSPPAEPPQELVPELAATIAGALWFNVYGTADLLTRTGGQVMVDNTSTVYASRLLSAEDISALNDGVERFASGPLGADYVERWYQPTGQLWIPVVTVHTTRDPIVPIQHQTEFRELAQTAGRVQLLEQFAVEGFGHGELLTYTGIPPDHFSSNPLFGLRLLAAFDYLVRWCATGVKP